VREENTPLDFALTLSLVGLYNLNGRNGYSTGKHMSCIRIAVYCCILAKQLRKIAKSPNLLPPMDDHRRTSYLTEVNRT
jgi:hypothetical protein